MQMAVEFTGGSRDGAVWPPSNIDLSQFPGTADDVFLWAIANHSLGTEVRLISAPSFEKYCQGSQIPGRKERWRITERETREDAALFIKCRYLGIAG
jgi:hypothetical protein